VRRPAEKFALPENFASCLSPPAR